MASYVLSEDTASLPHQHHQQPLLSGALRRGKWTPDEEAYAAAIIQYFLSGVLPIQYGTTLRGYIAQLLHCDPMRVSKKLIPGSVLMGVRIDPKIGRRSYYPCVEGTLGLEDHMQAALQRLAQFRALFIESVEREEHHEQTTSARGVASTTSVDLRRLSPLRHKKESAAGASVVDLRPLEAAKDKDATIAPPPSLPSLRDLLRQNRLRVPSNTHVSPPHVQTQPTEPHHPQYLHPARASVFHYASPPRTRYAGTHTSTTFSSPWPPASPPP